jgi:hypothetical protein
VSERAAIAPRAAWWLSAIVFLPGSSSLKLRIGLRSRSAAHGAGVPVAAVLRFPAGDLTGRGR